MYDERYNSSTIARQIRAIASEKDIHIGDLEAEIGRSAGYFSRITHSNGQLTVDAVITIANHLDMSIDEIISYDYEKVKAEKDLALLTEQIEFMSRKRDELLKKLEG